MGRPRIVNDEQLIPLMKEGLNHREIAEKLGVTRSAVTRAMQRVDPTHILNFSVEEFKRNENEMSAKLRMQAYNLLSLGLMKLQGDRCSVAELKQIAEIMRKLWDMERVTEGQPIELIGHGHRWDPKQMDEMKKIARDLSSGIVEGSIKQIELTGPLASLEDEEKE